MNLQRILCLAAAIAALIAAAMVGVVAAAFAVYAVARNYLGPAGAAAVVSAIFALIALVIGLAMGAKRPGRRGRPPTQEEGLFTKAIQLARQRPLMAAAVGALGAAVVIRNPAILSAVLSAAIAGRAAKPDR